MAIRQEVRRVEVIKEVREVAQAGEAVPTHRRLVEDTRVGDTRVEDTHRLPLEDRGWWARSLL